MRGPPLALAAVTVAVVLDENPGNLFDILRCFLKDYGCSLIYISISICIFFFFFFFFAFSLSRAKDVFYVSPRTCSSAQSKEEPPTYFEKRVCLFLALGKVTMVLKTF